MREGQEFFLINEEAEQVGYFSLIPDGETLWLKKLYILPTLQRGGYGAKVLDYILRNYRGFKNLSLYVNRENQRAQSFYLKNDFKVTAEVPVKMGDFDFIDLVMTRKL
jgi:ribosomal protein S18 acetylase RimI-like enzyme